MKTILLLMCLAPWHYQGPIQTMEIIKEFGTAGMVQFIDAKSPFENQCIILANNPKHGHAFENVMDMLTDREWHECVQWTFFIYNRNDIPWDHSISFVDRVAIIREDRLNHCQTFMDILLRALHWKENIVEGARENLGAYDNVAPLPQDNEVLPGEVVSLEPYTGSQANCDKLNKIINESMQEFNFVLDKMCHAFMQRAWLEFQNKQTETCA